ncbi:MAG: hypothetical protein BM485_08585 [Desulfobulbaceae bacterium DB1]|nr:MAG: hypothetical protein BM485_08585 [Desulfobulbaceae bacterium DB1]
MADLMNDWQVSTTINAQLQNASHIPARKRLVRDSYLDDLAQDMKFLERITKYSTDSTKPGRPKGSGDKAALHLVRKLWLVCRDCGKIPTRINRNGVADGLLHQLVKVLVGRSRYAADECESACNNDPLKGEIGIQN